MPTKDFTVSACLPYIEASGSGANPGDKHLPIGKWAAGTGLSWQTRALLKASISFGGMASINSATLRLSAHTAVGYHAHGSGSVGMLTRRRTRDWSESDGGGTATDETWGGGDMPAQVTGNTTDDGDGSSTVNNGASDGAVQTVSITKLVRAWYNGEPNYGLQLRANAEGDPANAAEFYSRRESGEAPVIRIDYETNQAPNAPTNLNPSGGEVVNTGRTITYSGTRSDPDAGDFIQQYDLEVRQGGTKIQDYTGNPGGTPTTFSKQMALPAGYNADVSYDWRARTMDGAGLWGPWSAYQAFRPNSAPDVPDAPGVDTDTLTPTITGTFTDPDPGDGPAYCQVEVEKVSPVTDMWLSADLAISTSPWSKVYAGSPLAWGTAYRARVKVRDVLGAWSGWSAWRDFTPTQPIGPDACTPRTTATKLNTLTPTLTVAHSSSFRNDQLEVYAANSLTSTRLYAKVWAGADYAAATSKAYVYAGTALAWGGTYYWRAQVEDSAGVIGAWTPLMPFYVNADPTPPTGLTARTSATAPPAVKDGVYLVTVLTPRLEAEYHDPDLGPYGDKPTSRTVEVYARNADGSAGALLHTNTLASPPYSVPMVYAYPAAPALVLNSQYLVRWRFTDNAGRVGPWSSYMTMRPTTGPTLTLIAPPAAGVVADQTPLLRWDFVGAAGKLQASYQVELFDRGLAASPGEESLVHDSGMTAGTDEQYQVPPGVVENGHAYRWQVTAVDSDGLTVVLT